MRRKIAALLPAQLSQIDIHTGGWLSVVVILGVTIIIGVSLARIVVNARNNYDVYLYEIAGLAKLQDENNRLHKALELK